MQDKLDAVVEDKSVAKPVRSGTVQSVEVALQILEAIADGDGAARVNNLARELDMTKAKVSRHLQTLLALGLVAKGPQEGYTFGWKLHRLARAATRDNSIGELATPHLKRLRDELQQTVILSVPVPQGAVVLLCISAQTTSITVRAATFLSLPHSPAARLSVALAPAGKDGAPLPEGAQLKHWPKFGAEYELDTGHGIGGVSVPVFDEGKALIGAVSLVAPTGSLRPRPSVKVVTAMTRCAKAIEAEHRRGSPAA